MFKFDKLIEEALMISARESFQAIFCTLSGNGILGPDSLIHVVLDVHEGMVKEKNNLKNISIHFD